MRKYSIVLQFDSARNQHLQGKHVRDGLSAVAKTGDYLWLVCDESVSVERLHTTDGGQSYGEHLSFRIMDFIDLPAGEDHEIDIEGLDYHDHYLWITGSHSLKRKKVKKSDAPAEQLRRLGKIQREANRYVIARIPLVKNAAGEFTLQREAPNPDHPERMLTAAQLQLSSGGNELYDALQNDEHLKPFLCIPGKDNGFDIEGMALYNNRLLLGLRGPVLRGWAVMLEAEIVAIGDDTLSLRIIGGKKYKKHFLWLGGMGIRSLTFSHRDLLVLAGPTMEIDGTIAVFRWKNAVDQLDEENVIASPQIERLFDVPHGFGMDTGRDKAEGMTLLSDRELLVVYDTPKEDRKSGEEEVLGDVFEL